MARTLIVSYSRTGNTQRVGEELGRLLNADVEHIKEEKSRAGILGYLRSGREALKKIVPNIKAGRLDPADYALVVIGTPIWAGRMASPVRAYLERYKNSLQNIAVFCTEGGSGDETAFNEISALCNLEPIATMTLTTRQVKSGSFENELQQFAETLH